MPFDGCRHVHFVEITGTRIQKQSRQPVVVEESWDFARSLKVMKIDFFICGAIPQYFLDWFQSKKVRVIPDQKGSVQENLGKWIERITCTQNAERTAS